MKKLLLIGLIPFFYSNIALADSRDLSFKSTNELSIVASSSVDAVNDMVIVVKAGGQPVLAPATTIASSNPVVALNVNTSIVAATHAHKTLVLGGAGSARTMTLPAATGSGAVYSFVVGAVNTSNYLIVRAGSDVIKGALVFASDNGTNAELGFETGNTGIATITLNGTSTGGAGIGDYVTLQDIASGVWVVRGQVTESGSEATPFS